MEQRFIGRKKELEALKAEYEKEAFSAAVVYGRRRVGKSFLIRNFIKNKKNIFFQASENNASNLTELSRLIGESLFGSDGVSYTSYDDAFRAVFSYKGKEKLIFVIDELPYIARKEDRTVLSVLQRFVDQNQDNNSLMLIISGSSISYIESEVLSTEGPLYGRIPLQIELRAFTIQESIDYLNPCWSIDDKINAHVISGGIPFYLKAFKDYPNLNEALEKVLFNSLGGLFNEVKLFFSSSVRNFATYDTILRLISKGANVNNEISDKSHMDKSNISAALNKLRILRICEQKTNILREKDKKKWIISDNFFAFYYKFVAPRQLLIENDINIDIGKMNEEISLFVSKAIEKDFLRFVLTLDPENVLEAGYGEFANPNTKVNEEIDLVIKYDDGTVSFGECKWKKNKIGLNALEDLKRKASIATACSIRKYYLLSRSGFDSEIIEEAKRDKRIVLITTDEFVK